MNSERRNEQELVDESIKRIESGGDRAAGAARARKLRQQMRQMADDHGA